MKLVQTPEIGDKVELGDTAGVISGFFPAITRPAHAATCPTCRCPSISLFAGRPTIDLEDGNAGLHIDPSRFNWDEKNQLWRIGPVWRRREGS